MNYTSLEDAYGAPFKQRAPVTHERKDVKETFEAKPKAKPEFSSLSDRGQESIKKNQHVVDAVMKSLPLDKTPGTENFGVYEEKTPRTTLREKFTGSQPANMVTDFDQSEKLALILRLIEQNKTGYERPATQDMLLYIFTGVFFLFTFDTFVMLGKSMRGK
jgi:hypothetical protein